LDANDNVTEYVAAAKVTGPPVTLPSRFNLYIWNGYGVASADLVAEAQKVVDGYIDSNGNPVAGYKAAGDICSVVSVQTVLGNVTIEAVAVTGTDETALGLIIVQVVSSYIQGLTIGQRFALNEMIRRVKNLTGVSDFEVIVYPATVIDVGEVLIPGNITVTFP
jgi:hypothetical protein